ncbi:MAG: hypothetical protein H7831_07715 [Magnetococcus sp. WYHC-3]
MNRRLLLPAVLVLCCGTMMGCTQESQNKLGRAVRNWTGNNGVLEIYAGEKLVRRFMGVDKLTTGSGTDDGQPRAFRFGYGYLDRNLDMTLDQDESKAKLYFEFSDYSTSYVFFEAPGQ